MTPNGELLRLLPIKVDCDIEAFHEGDVVFPLGGATKDNIKSQFFTSSEHLREIKTLSLCTLTHAAIL